MAKRREIIVAVVIGIFVFTSMGIFALLLVGMMADAGDLEFSGLGEKIGVIEVGGVLTEVSGRPVIKQLERWTESGSIAAIVVHINSPGGGVAISQEIYDSIRRAREEKPVVASMASVAASGGYYIACGADRIIANQGTITGSIGVIFEFHTAAELMDKIGIETETIKSGELKDVGTYARAMTKKEELMLRSVVMDTYEQFVEVVATGRSMEKESVYPLADGSIFTGLQAYNLGLVDTLGGLSEAIDLAADLADVTDPTVVRPKKKRSGSIFDLLGEVSNVVTKVSESNISGPRLLYQYK